MRAWGRISRYWLGLAAVAAAAAAPFCISSGAYAQKQDTMPALPVVRPNIPRPPEPAKTRPPGTRLSNPRADLQRAISYMEAQAWGDAIGILESVTARYPEISEAPELLAQCYLKAGRPKDAAAVFERILAQQPNRLTCIRDLGLAYMDMGEKDMAVATWRRALAMRPPSGAYYGTVARLEQDAGLYAEAIATLREGLGVKEYRSSYASQIVHLEKVIGREEDAFRDALLMAGEGDAASPIIGSPAVDIFAESKEQDKLLAITDSAIVARGAEGERLRFLKSILLVNRGNYREAGADLFGPKARKIPEGIFYSMLQEWERSKGAVFDERRAAFFKDACARFLADYPSSYLAPSVMLMMARSDREAALRGGPDAARLASEALALADQAMKHKQGIPYQEEAALFKARVLFEDLHKPDDALAQLDGVAWRTGRSAPDAAGLRVRALLATGDWGKAEKELKILASSKDSSMAILGRYGLGRMRFLMGSYDGAVASLSALAELHPESPWANDALETAIAVKEAIGDKGALDLYRSAALASERGEYARALDSLAALRERFPQSKLGPRALFMTADIEAASGRSDAAVADFTRLTELFPLHELAPRALERIADMAQGKSPAEAIKDYGVIMERYPDYAFLERVRDKYISLGKATPTGTGPAGAPATGKAPAGAGAGSKDKKK
jgi:tetratricopeptide (TPR) repeat protein